MNNFNFYNPVELVFGKGSISNLSKLIPAGTKVLITYGKGSIKKNGVYDQVVEQLKDFEWTEFGGIEPNPRYETCMKAVEIVKQQGIGFILAVGGGSVIDGTKFIAAAAEVEGDPWDIMTGKTPVKKSIPLGTVLTLPATGSEMNGGAVVSKEETKEKYAFWSVTSYPKFSILDPEYCFSLPAKQVTNGIVDAFVHVMEQYLTYPCDAPLQDRLAEAVLATLVEEGPKVKAEQTNYTAMANLVWSATMALNGVIGAGVPADWGTHVIGHEITALYGLDHAETLAVVLPGMMNIMRENKKEKTLQYGERIWNITEGSDDERIDATIAKTEAFFNAVGMKTKLSDYNLGEEAIAAVVARFEERKQVFGEKGDVDFAVVEKILKDRL